MKHYFVGPTIQYYGSITFPEKADKFLKVERSLQGQMNYVKMLQMANFTFDQRFPHVTIPFLRNIATLDTRRFVIKLLLHLYKDYELFGRSATGKRAPTCKGGNSKQPIDQERKNFILGKNNISSTLVILTNSWCIFQIKYVNDCRPFHPDIYEKRWEKSISI